jgi:RNA polymerase sigma-70 factor (ECF subfamily)
VLDADPAAWTELLRRYRSLVYRCITKAISRSGAWLCEDDHDEVYCEFCLNLLRNDMKKLRAYDPERGVKLSSWLGLLAINTAYDCLRKRARYPLLAPDEQTRPEPAAEQPGPLEDLLVQERRQALARLVRGLSARDRDFVHLYYQRGLEADHVAAVMGISVKTVYTKKHKIRARLTALAAEDRLAA